MKQLVVCALALAVAGPAAAQTASAFEVTTSVAARHGDLDLNRSADAAVMVRRIERAALSACGASDFSLRQYREAVRNSACYRESMDTAVASLNVPTVTAIHRDRASFSVASN
jgi:UrcA family protein